MGDGRVGQIEDFLRRAVILHQLHNLEMGVTAVAVFEILNVIIICSAETVNALIFISHSGDACVLFGDEIHDFIEGVIVVLIFVNEDVSELLLDGLQNVRIVFQQRMAMEQHIAEVQRFFALFCFLKPLVDVSQIPQLICRIFRITIFVQ